MREMKEQRDYVVTRFGSEFSDAFGWAASALGNLRPHFSDLEAAAQLANLRSHYKWASHEVHADAKSARLNIYDRGEVLFKASGPIEVGLSDSGHLAAISLYQSTVALVMSDQEPSPRDLIAMAVLQRLVDAVGNEFQAGHKSVEAAEARYRRGLNHPTDARR